MTKRIFSGVKPSGELHLGNYLGAIKQWVELQDSADEAIFCVVDLHAITVPQNPEELRKNILSIAAIYLAAGINPSKSSIFVQSAVPAHSELAWILNCLTRNSDLTKMTQFKDKTGVDFENLEKELQKASESDSSEEVKKAASSLTPEEAEKNTKYAAFETSRHFFQQFKESFNSVGVGLFDYPVLMAADILLYNTTHVPVGEDQKQHVELTRDIARRFNNRYGDTFVIPQAIVKSSSARIMSLDNPAKKMAKSAESAAGYIALTDDADTIRQKIKRAVTDSGAEIKAGPDKPAITNLLNIFSEVSGKAVSQIEQEFAGKGYGEFKEALAEAVVKFLTPIQTKYNEYIKDEAKLISILEEGKARVEPIAQKMLKEVKSKVGLGY